MLRKMAAPAAATSLRPIFKWAGGPGRSIDEGHKPNGPDDHVHAVEKKRGGMFPSRIARFFLPRYLNSYKQSELLDLYPNFSFFSLLKLPLLPPLFFEKLPLLPPVHALRAPAAVCWWRCLHVAACTCRRLHEPPSRTYSLEKKHYLTF